MWMILHAGGDIATMAHAHGRRVVATVQMHFEPRLRRGAAQCAPGGRPAAAVG